MLAPSETAIPHLKAVLEQDDLFTEEYISNRQVLKSLLKELLTDSDREEIAAAGANLVGARIISQLNFSEQVGAI